MQLAVGLWDVQISMNGGFGCGWVVGRNNQKMVAYDSCALFIVAL